MNPDQNQQQAPAPQPASQPMHAGNNKTLMGVLAYLGILILVPYFMSKNDPFVKFHIKQGLVLFIAEAIMWLLPRFFWGLWWSLGPVISILDLAILVLAIIGIINVTQSKEKELPLVGHLAAKFTI